MCRPYLKARARHPRAMLIPAVRHANSAPSYDTCRRRGSREFWPAFSEAPYAVAQSSGIRVTGFCASELDLQLFDALRLKFGRLHPLGHLGHGHDSIAIGLGSPGRASRRRSGSGSPRAHTWRRPCCARRTKWAAEPGDAVVPDRGDALDIGDRPRPDLECGKCPLRFIAAPSAGRKAGMHLAADRAQ